MKKTFLFLALAIAITSCGKESNTVPSKTTEIGKYTIVEIDGCEYIEFDHGYGSSRVHTLVHKGNCFNHGTLQ